MLSSNYQKLRSNQHLYRQSEAARRELTDTGVEVALVPRSVTRAVKRALSVVALPVVAAVRRVQTLVDVFIAVWSCPAWLITRRTTDDFIARPDTDASTFLGTVLTPVTVNTFCNVVYITNVYASHSSVSVHRHILCYS